MANVEGPWVLFHEEFSISLGEVRQRCDSHPVARVFGDTVDLLSCKRLFADRYREAWNLPAWLGEKAMEAATRAKRVIIWKVFMVTIIIYFVLKCYEGCGCQTVQMLMM